jgi:hypothetical protein
LSWSFCAASSTDEIREVRPAKEVRPAERGGIVLVVADVGVGARIEQEARYVDGTALRALPPHRQNRPLFQNPGRANFFVHAGYL